MFERGENARNARDEADDQCRDSESGDDADDEDDDPLSDHLRTVSVQALDFVRDRPLVAVGIAAAAGFLLGRAFSR
jgi:ElaB/YqjD/DUF883 family membrane-anchored ribosome-binding protein